MDEFIAVRRCGICGKDQFLSGLAHIERGYVRAMACYACVDEGATIETLKALTRTDTVKRLRGSKDKHADRT